MQAVGKQLLTKLQTQYDGATLNAVSRILCISSQNAYQIAHGQRQMASDTILIACDCLGLDARPWLIQAEIDACKSPQRRQILMKILADLGTAVSRSATGVAAFLMMGFSGFFPL
jgi:plasmid maintenance system antidote protein VapI